MLGHCGRTEIRTENLLNTNALLFLFPQEKQLFAVIAYPACLNLGIFSDKLFASSGSLKAVRSCRSSAVSQG